MTEGRIRVGLIGTGRIAGFVHLPSLRLLPELCEVTAVASRDAHEGQGVRRAVGRSAGARHLGGARRRSRDRRGRRVPAERSQRPRGGGGAWRRASTSSARSRSPSRIRRRAPWPPRPPGLRAGSTWSPSPSGSRRGCGTSSVSWTRALRRHPALAHVLLQRRSARSAASLRLAPSAARGGAGVIADMGSHMIDAARYLLGRYRRSQRREPHLRRRARRSRPAAAAEWRPPRPRRGWPSFASGVIGTFDVSRGVAGRGGTGRPQYQGVEIHGTGGAALYELMHPFQLQMCLGPAMVAPPALGDRRGAPDLAVLSGLTAQSARRRPAPRVQVRSGRRVRPRGPRRDDRLPDLPRWGRRPGRGRRRRRVGARAALDRGRP